MQKHCKKSFVLVFIILFVFTLVACADNKETFTVSFDANGGTGTMTSQSYTENEAQNLKANTFAKDGHHFVGWAASADGRALYANGAVITLTTDITLYAVWSETQPEIADFIPMAPTVESSGSLLFTSHYTASVSGKIYYGVMIKINTVTGKDYSITVSDTDVYGWILCGSDGSELQNGIFSNGKGKVSAAGSETYLLIGFEEAPKGSFTVAVADYAGVPGESEKYAIALQKDMATGVKTLKSYGQTWYAITVADDGKSYGLTVTLTGTNNNLVVYLFSKNPDGTADRQNYKFFYAASSGIAALDNFKLPSGISAVQGTDPYAGAGQYFIMVMASGAEYSYNLLFTDIQ